MKKSAAKKSEVSYVRVEKSESELLLISINNELKNRKRTCASYKEKFEEDFIDGFKFYGEDMCVQTIWVKHLGWILKNINDGKTIDDTFTMCIQMYEGRLRGSYNVRVNSTSALARELSIFEYQTFIELHAYLINLKKSYPKAF